MILKIRTNKRDHASPSRFRFTVVNLYMNRAVTSSCNLDVKTQESPRYIKVHLNMSYFH